MWLQLECLVPAAAELQGIAIKIKRDNDGLDKSDIYSVII
jgi:hypothetical protein